MANKITKFLSNSLFLFGVMALLLASLGQAQASVPTVTSISPASGPTKGGINVVINGTGFSATMANNLATIGGQPCTLPFWVSTTQVNCFTPPLVAGPAAVVVTTTAGSSSGTVQFTYENPPTVTSITPVAASDLGGTNVFIAGSGFDTTTTVTIGGQPCSNVTLLSSTYITCVTPASLSMDNSVPVAVTTQGGTSTATVLYTYMSGPSVTSISPAIGNSAGGDNLTITGRGFDLTPGNTTLTIQGQPCVNAVVVSPTTITCTTPPSSTIPTAGPADVVVTTLSGSGTDPGGFTGFTYYDSATITSVSPNIGLPSGGTNVTITGTSFYPTSTVTFYPTGTVTGGANLVNPTVVNLTTITGQTPPGTAGAQDVVVTNPVGSATLPSSYSYVNLPTVTSISPAFGNPVGGDNVTINGTGFDPTTTATIGGQPCLNETVVNTTTITCTTPSSLSSGSAAVVVTTQAGSSSGTVQYVMAFVPNAPTHVTAVAGNALAIVNFTAPTNNGGSAITGYTVTSIPSGGVDSNAGSNGLTHTITGLTNGTSYTFTVHAANALGNSVESSASNSVIPNIIVTASAGPNGIISPASLTVLSGNVASFTVTPYTGYTASVSGCGNGSLNGSTYTTGSIVANCTVSALFTKSALGGASAASAVMVSTLAGDVGVYAYKDGTGTAAQFINPAGIATDGTNLYVADYAYNNIRKIVISTGVVTTIAGSMNGTQGSGDYTGTSASFTNPIGITTDGTNLYVADSGNSTIRKIVISTGAVTTLAGSAGVTGLTDNTGTSARFAFPAGITTDGTNIYVADTFNNTIRQVVISSGEVTTLAGSTSAVAGSTDSTNGKGATAQFSNPTAITTDGTNLYVADTNNNTIRQVVISSGNVTTLAGSAGAAGVGSNDATTGAAAQFNAPTGIATDGTNLYVTDTGNFTIRKIVIASGVVTTIAGSAGSYGYTNGSGTVARFNGPQGIATDGTSLYVSESGNATIRKLSSSVSTPTSAFAPQLNLSTGWNLVGNSVNVPFTVASAFGSTTNVNTVWKWLAASNQWAFYAPSYSSSALASYAAAYNYAVLTTINPGEGFWVNAKTAFSVQLPSGTAVPTLNFQNASSNALPSGWSLISVGDSPTPRAFNNGISASPPSSGSIPPNLTSLWAWSNTSSSWYFYTPILDSVNTLGAYITSHNYLNFGGNLITPTMGFWVNHP